MQNFPDNTLYELDNLPVLRGMNSETVDLIQRAKERARWRMTDLIRQTLYQMNLERH